jgi:hypothetical protein
VCVIDLPRVDSPRQQIEETKMRYTMIAVAAGIVLAALPASAQKVHNAGAPNQEGTACWVSTDSTMGYGYWEDCPVAHAVAGSHVKKRPTHS